MKIGIIGLGFVGSAIYNNIKDKSIVKIYDPAFAEYDYIDNILDTDIVFICVPTPLSYGKMDAKAVNSTLKFLDSNLYTGLVVIKSTIHPSYLEKTINLELLSNPEFLNENSAFDDFKNQTLNIIGGRLDLAYKLKSIYDDYFNLNCEYEFMSLNEALIFKYIRNIKTAYDVMYWEFVNETTNNFRKYKRVLDKIPVNVNNISLDGNNGFGGSCLPKDTASYPKHELTEFLLKFNNRIRR